MLFRHRQGLPVVPHRDLRAARVEPMEDLPHVLREALLARPLQRGRNAVEGLCDGACDAGQGIAVAAEGDCGADDVLKIRPLEEGGDGLRDRALAALHVAVGRRISSQVRVRSYPCSLTKARICSFDAPVLAR